MKALIVLMAAVSMLAIGWRCAPKSWEDVKYQWGMDPARPENASEAFNRGVSPMGLSGAVMALGIFSAVGALVAMLVAR